MRNLNQFLTMTAMTFAAGFILFAATEVHSLRAAPARA